MHLSVCSITRRHRHRYATAFVLANSTKVGHWAHPLQIPVGGSLGEMGPRAWHDPAEYEATAALEAAWVDIAAEVASLPSGKEGYVAFLVCVLRCTQMREQSEPHRVPFYHHHHRDCHHRNSRSSTASTTKIPCLGYSTPNIVTHSTCQQSHSCLFSPLCTNTAQRLIQTHKPSWECTSGMRPTWRMPLLWARASGPRSVFTNRPLVCGTRQTARGCQKHAPRCAPSRLSALRLWFKRRQHEGRCVAFFNTLLLFCNDDRRLLVACGHTYLARLQSSTRQ